MVGNKAFTNLVDKCVCTSWRVANIRDAVVRFAGLGYAHSRKAVSFRIDDDKHKIAFEAQEQEVVALGPGPVDRVLPMTSELNYNGYRSA